MLFIKTYDCQIPDSPENVLFNFAKIVFSSLSNISVGAFVKMVDAIIGVSQSTKYASVIYEPFRTNALTHT